MSLAAVSLEDLLADFDLTAAKWRKFFEANPGAAEVSTDIAGMGNVGGVAWHLYTAAGVHSQRLLGEPVTNYREMTPVMDMAAAWKMHAIASANLRRFLNGANDAALNEAMTFTTRSGEMTVPRRKLCLHIFVHAIRHWAQIGPLVRQNGFPVGWPQDVLFSEAIR